VPRAAFGEKQRKGSSVPHFRKLLPHRTFCPSFSSIGEFLKCRTASAELQASREARWGSPYARRATGDTSAAFDIFDILKRESQEKCRVFDFQNCTFIKRTSTIGHGEGPGSELDFLISNLKKIEGFRANLIFEILIKNQVCLQPCPIAQA